MGNLERRLRGLEAKPPRRCPTCAGWGNRVTYESESEGYDLSPSAPVPALPECCPDCGFVPLTVAIVYVERGIVR